MLSFEVIQFPSISKEIAGFQTVDSTRADSLELRDESKIQKVYRKFPTALLRPQKTDMPLASWINSSLPQLS